MKFTILTLAFLLISTHLMASGLDGKYVAETEDGKTAVLVLSSDDMTISGTLELGGSKGIIREGSFDGEKLSVAVRFPEHDVMVAFTGTVASDNSIEITSSGLPGGDLTLSFIPEAR
jgi:hypothetical protein